MKKVILYHYFKHQFSSHTDWLQNNKRCYNENIQYQLKTIGNSQLDYYIGILSKEQIETEVYDLLNREGYIETENYKLWIEKNNGFREIRLSDNSKWTLRYLEKETYIHIHPSRYSPHTIRVKANTLKTVLCVLLFENMQTSSFDTNTINKYRKDYLKLSFIKTNGQHTELINIFKLFEQELIKYE